MSILSEILKANSKFQPPAEILDEDHAKSKLPAKHLAVVTCMDTRLVGYLEPAMGISRGDAKFIKTAGNCITGVFDGTIRSLLVCIFELGVKEIAVIGHHECGMAKTTAESLTTAMISRGISPDAIQMVHKDLAAWADGFQQPEQNVIDTVAAIRSNPLIPKDVPIHGLMFHPREGSLEIVVDGYEDAKSTLTGKLDEAKSALESKKDEVKGAIESKKEEVSEKIDDAKSALESKKDEVKDAIESKKEEVSDKIDDAKEAVSEKVSGAKEAVGNMLENLGAKLKS